MHYSIVINFELFLFVLLGIHKFLSAGEQLLFALKADLSVALVLTLVFFVTLLAQYAFSLLVLFQFLILNSLLIDDVLSALLLDLVTLLHDFGHFECFDFGLSLELFLLSESALFKLGLFFKFELFFQSVVFAPFLF